VRLPGNELNGEVAVESVGDSQGDSDLAEGRGNVGDDNVGIGASRITVRDLDGGRTIKANGRIGHAGNKAKLVGNSG